MVKVRSSRIMRQALKATVLSVATLGACTSVSADTLFGVHAGVFLWQPDVKGTIGQTGNNFDFSSEFSEGDSDGKSGYVAVEHFVPLIPNVMFRRTSVDWTGSSDSASGTLGGLINLSGRVDASLDINLTDATLYYEILDNWVSIDLGLTVRAIDGTVSLSETDTAASDEAELDYTIPMLYAHARIDLPFSGLAVGVRGNAIGYEGNTLSDLEAYVHLEMDLIPTLDVGIQAGVRRLQLDIDDIDDWTSDATIEGAFVGLTVHF